MIAEKVIGDLIKGSFPFLIETFGLLKEELEHYSSNLFTPYLVRKYESLNESTSQLFRNKGYKIDELYIPLTLQDNLEDKSFCIDRFPSQLFKSDKKIIIKDSAGMGKSTILKMIFRYAFDNGHIAFYIDLKSLIKDGKVQNVEDYLQQDLPDLKSGASKEFLLKLLSDNKFYFMFDGADEVPDKHKEELFSKVVGFCERVRKSSFIVATRDEDAVLSSFHTFKSYSINSLEKEEAYELLRKYEFKDVKADFLIEELEKDKNKAVLEFLKNPLLTTLLYTAYSYKKKIPLKKNLFYSQVFSALYENHDATKIGYLTRKKYSGLSIDSFERILSHLAYNSRVVEELEYSRTDLLRRLEKISEAHPTIEFDPNLFIKDLTTSVPIFRKDGNSYIWQHKSIQEYFYVRFLVLVLDSEQKQRVVSNLLKQSDLKKFKLILDILFDEDEEFFHQNITRFILNFVKNEMKVRGYDFNSAPLNVFYKYLFGFKVTLNKMQAKSLPDIFEELESRLRVDFSIPEDYTSLFMTMGLGKKDAVQASAIYAHIYTIILDILGEKNASFVEMHEFENKHSHYDEGTLSFSNLTRVGVLTEIEKMGIRAEISILDIPKCDAFINDLDEKIEKRNNLLIY